MKERRRRSIRDWLPELLFGMVGAGILCVGKSIYETTDFRGIAERPAVYLLFWLVGSALTAALLYGFDRLLKRTGGIPQLEKCRKVLERKEAFWILGAILIAVYGFCYLSYFPGTYAYDAPPQTYQAYDRDPLNTHHPVFHTLFWALCLRIGTGISGGNEAGGLVVYSVCQILFVVAVTMFTVYWIYKATRNVYATLAAYLYYLLTPMLQLMSFSLTKDILFSCFLILFCMSLVQVVKNPGGRYLAAVFGTGLLACLFRNNMVYVVMLALIAAFVLRYMSKIRLVLLGVIFAYYIIMKVLFPVMGVQEGEKSETFPAVLVQLSGIYVDHPEVLDEEEREIILSYIPDAEAFNRHFADYVKSSFNNKHYEEDPETFWTTYFQILAKAPVECLCLFLDLNVDYWYPGAMTPDPYSARRYIETDTLEREIYWVDNAGLLPGVHSFYEKVADHDSWFMKIPVLCYFYSLAFPFVSMVVCLYLMIRHKRKEGIVVFTVLIGLFLTFILGPVSNFRYIYGYYLAFPLYFCIAAGKTPKEEIGK